MTLRERLQDIGLKFEYFVYRTAIYWILAFILAVFAFAIYIHMSIWYECRSEGHSFFYCVFLTST